MPLLLKNIYSFAFHLEEDVNFSACVKGPTCSTRMSPPTAPPLLALCDPYSPLTHSGPPTLASPALSHHRTRSLTVPIVWALCPDRYMAGSFPSFGSQLDSHVLGELSVCTVHAVLRGMLSQCRLGLHGVVCGPGSHRVFLTSSVDRTLSSITPFDLCHTSSFVFLMVFLTL